MIHCPLAGPSPGVIANTTPVLWTWLTMRPAVVPCVVVSCSAASRAGPTASSAGVFPGGEAPGEGAVALARGLAPQAGDRARP